MNFEAKIKSLKSISLPSDLLDVKDLRNEISEYSFILTKMIESASLNDEVDDELNDLLGAGSDSSGSSVNKEEVGGEYENVLKTCHAVTQQLLKKFSS